MAVVWKRLAYYDEVGDVIGPSTNSDGYIPQWDGTNTKTLKNGLSVVTTVGETGSDSAIPTEQAVREALAGVGGSGDSGDIESFAFFMASLGS